MNNWRIDQTIDLQRQEAAAYPAYGRASLGDSEAHTWAVTVTDGGTPVDLNGVSVVVSAVNSQGQTIPATGTISGNVAAAVLPAECYALTGLVRCTMRLVAVGRTITSAYLEINVTRADTTTVIDPGDVVPNLAELIAAVPLTNAATAAAQIAANMGAGLNLHINTGFCANTNGWTLSANVVRDTSKSLFGAYVVKSEQSGLGTDAWRGISTLTANRIPCELNDNFTGSVWVFFDNASLFDQPIRIEVAIYNASGARITSASYDYTPVAADQNRWLRIFANRLANVEGAASAGIAVSIRRNGRAWFACPKLERYTNGTPSDWRPSWADILALPYTEDWITPTFVGSWAAHASYPLRYCKDASGFVHFKGKALWAATGTFTTLPAGYRAGGTYHFLIPRETSGSNCARMSVQNSGALYCDSVLNAGEWIDLTGVCYRAEA